MAIRFYSWPQSSGSRVQWALEELGLPYEYKKIDAQKKEHKSPEYLAIHPNGKVPALVEDDETTSSRSPSFSTWRRSTACRRSCGP